MSSENIRLAHCGDIDGIYSLEIEHGVDVYSKAIIADAINNEHYLNLVMVVNDEYIGYVSINYLLDEADLLKIVIASKHRRKGYGKALLKYAIELLKEKEIQNVFLEVRVSNIPAKKLYESLNFKIINQRKKYYQDEVDADIYLLCL
jgi:ribosomal-protein-alanine N-acetyltransferase